MDVNGTRYHLLLGERDFAPVVAASQTSDGDTWRWLEATGVPEPQRSQAVASFRPLAWDDAWASVRLLRRLPKLKPSSGAQALRAEDRRGASADRFGNIFWISQDRTRVRVRPAATDAAGDYWTIASLHAACAPRGQGLFRSEHADAASQPLQLSGLAVTGTHHLMVGTLAPAGLLIFDLHSAGGPCWWRWPDAIDFTPYDFAPTADDGLVILDRPEFGGPRLWRLSPDFRVLDLDLPLVLAPSRAEDFHGEGAAPGIRPAELFGGPVDLRSASSLEAENPIALMELPDRSVLIIDAGTEGAPARIQRWHGARLTDSILLNAVATSPQLGVALTHAHDCTALIDSGPETVTISGRLLLVTAEAAQVFVLRFSVDADELSLSLDPVALPLQRFAGKALVSAGDRAFYDSTQRDPDGERWIPLTEQPRYRYLREAWIEGDVRDDDDPLNDLLIFDGKQPGCVWHRAMLDACIPAGCEVQIESRAADERGLLTEIQWLREPTPYRRGDGSELPFHRPFDASDNDSRLGTFETLLQAATGRYLAIRLTLRGDGRSSPRVRALRVYYPRFSYLHQYLPAAYREEEEAAGFLERYLCNVEGIFTAIEGRVERAEILFDPAVMPAEYLPWLSAWLGLMLEEGWGEARKRLFLRYAWLLFRWRGTRPGLLAWLRLVTEPCPNESIFAALEQGGHESASCYGGGRVRIVESFELRRFPGLSIGDRTAIALPALVDPGTPWRPSQGGQELNARFVDFLRQRYGRESDYGDAPALQRLSEAWGLVEPYTEFSQVRFSAVQPENEIKAGDWLAFIRTAFDFQYPSVRSDEVDRYREFLARRYGNKDDLNEAYGRGGENRWGGFSAIALPSEDELPADGTPLADWIDFVSLALPVARSAHRFHVLVPASPREPSEQRERRAARIETLVRCEKPAHTDFDVKLFWELFQVGTARLGIDSLLGEGGRFVATVLETGFLGEGYLSEGHPWSVTDRTLVGRDRLQG